MLSRCGPLSILCLVTTLASSCGAQTALETDADSGVDTTDSATYGAVWFAMALDRFAVYKLDEINDRCTVVGFVHPIDYETPGIELPERWAVEFAFHGDAASCDGLGVGTPSVATPSDAITAMAVSGWASWDDDVCEIDVDLVLEFEGEPEEVFRAAGIEPGWGWC